MKVEDKAKTVARPGAGEAFHVTKDHSIDDVIQANKDGYSITFSGDKDKFVKFNGDDFAKLPKTLMVYYNIAQQDFYDNLDSVVETMTGAGTMAREFGYDKRVADPGDQLKVLWLAPGFTSKWVRAYDNEIARHESNGYMVARGKIAKTFANDGSKPGIHYVGSEDNPELILMVISIENSDKNEERIKRSSTKMKEAAKVGYKRSVESVGRGATAEVTERLK